MVEIKETDKFVIAKPVAFRPGYSYLKSFSPVLPGAVNASTPATFSDTAVRVIRPRTAQFKPACNNNLDGAKALGSAGSDPSKEVAKSKVVSNVVYKPIAKLVSRKTIAFLANLGGHGIIPTREITQNGTPIQPSNQLEHQTDRTLDTHKNFPPHSDKNANATLENPEDYSKPLPNNGDRPSHDGHNWRKYGQKQVKGSEYPRSYYKCTHPNCPIKKKVEKTLDGRIAEIVYRGEHNHSEPQPLNYDDATTRNEVVRNPPFINQEADRGGCDDGRMEVNQNNIESFGQSPISISVPLPPIDDTFTAANSSNSLAMSGECEEVSETLEAEGGDFKSKRMKRENQLLKESSTVGGDSSEPRIVVQNNTDSGIVGDGFRWRKYGQKVVKGKIYPRSYYKCTSLKCNVRKYVERMSEDPCSIITTYEGRHNHSMPIKSTNAGMSKAKAKNKS
ncbi:hypothetical protein OROHE_013150 [Orobanche hederae]